MNEEFLQYVWKFRLFLADQLRTTENEPVEVIQPGIHNHDEGPDFSNARIKIGKTVWAGNIEIHVNASDWDLHLHDQDENYQHIILHVVLNDDRKKKSPGNFPTLELKNRIPENLYAGYRQLIDARLWIPCSGSILSIDPGLFSVWLDSLLIERLQHKTNHVLSALNQNKNNWEETFYILLAENFGFKTNAVPFRLLAKSLPYLTLAKHKNSLFQLEALLFGQSGLISRPRDEYDLALKKEFDFLQKKYSLQPIKGSLWKFLRMRPSNFPTIRLAQFAVLIHQSSHLVSKILEAGTPGLLSGLFRKETSDYWLTHFTFGKSSAKKSKVMGQHSVNLLMINTVVPFVYAYGMAHSSEDHKNSAFNLLEMLPAEKNSVITKWQAEGIPIKSASQTQALLQLKNNYCSLKNCLTCRVGNKLIQDSCN